MRENGKKREEKRIFLIQWAFIDRSLTNRTLIRNCISEPCTESTFRKQKASTGSIEIWNQIKSTSPCSRNVRHARGEQWKGVPWSRTMGRSMTLEREIRKRSGARSVPRKRVKSGPATTEALNETQSWRTIAYHFLINASRSSWSALLGLSLVELKRDCSTTCCSRLKPIAAWRMQKEILLVLLRNVGETCVIL